MNTVVVRCASCLQLSRVAAEAVGLAVACPRCGAAFVAAPVPAGGDPPVVRSAGPARVPVVRPRPAPVVWELPEPTAPDVERTPATGGLIALALLPFGIPLLWLLVSALARREVVMSFAVPVAVAAGASGLGFGLVHVSRWSVAARVKAMVALLLLSYLVTGGLFVVRKEWLQDLRRVFNRGPLNWQTFHAEPPDDAPPAGRPKEPKLIGFRFKHPAGVSEVAAPSPFPDWRSKTYALTDRGRPGSEVYTAAVARVPGVKPWDANRVWFAGVDAAVRDAAPGATVAEERAVTLRDRVTQETLEGKEFHLTRPGEVWNRVVRVYRVKGHAIYLAVEGPHLTPDVADVAYFLESLRGPFD